jgi:hypothetical protein
MHTSMTWPPTRSTMTNLPGDEILGLPEPSRHDVDVRYRVAQRLPRRQRVRLQRLRVGALWLAGRRRGWGRRGTVARVTGVQRWRGTVVSAAPWLVIGTAAVRQP